MERPIFEGLYKATVELRETRERPPRGMVEPEPNAPLLIRIVRDPYEEVPRGPRRKKLYDPIRLGGREREQREPPARDARAHRGEPTVGNPLKTLELHPVPLAPPPPVDEWLASRGTSMESEWNA
ncbi:MAG: hypothetical protein EA397_15395 [Deltaproteobacteria bacterium]|nr:MAG: hypothetical protein EA397_15395 [Deltaproteobacteria bacterium]